MCVCVCCYREWDIEGKKIWKHNKNPVIFFCCSYPTKYKHTNTQHIPTMTLQLPNVHKYLSISDNEYITSIKELGKCGVIDYRILKKTTSCIMNEQLSNAWFKAREGRITGSKVPKVMGLFEKKSVEYLGMGTYMIEEGSCTRGLVEADLTSDVKVNVRLQWGTTHELTALHDFYGSTDCSKDIFRTGMWKFTKQSLYSLSRVFDVDYDFNSFPLMGASPDAIDVRDGYIIEIKCPCPYFVPNDKVHKFIFWKNKPYKAMKPYYLLQIYLQMICIGIYKAKLVSWTFANGYTVFTIYMERELLKIILEMLIVYKKTGNVMKDTKTHDSFLQILQWENSNITKTKKCFENRINLNQI